MSICKHSLKNGARQASGREEVEMSVGYKDKYKIVFIVLLMHGIGCLLPWNMFITAENYFRNYKLMPAPINGTGALERDISEQNLDNLRKNFLSYLGSASKIPCASFAALNLIVSLKSGNLAKRVNISLTLQAIIFSLTISLTRVDSYKWPGAFFCITMASVVLLNMASGVYQNCVFGTGAKFPGSYTNAILIGSNLSGTFTSVINLITIWLAPEPQIAATYYFITALLVILVCIVSYNLLHLNPFFRHYDSIKSAPEGQLEIKTTEDNKKVAGFNNSDVPDTMLRTLEAMVPRAQEPNDNDGSSTSELNKKWLVFKKCWPQCLNVFLTFYITLSVFPAVLADVKQGQGYFSERYFAAVACFFVFNFFAMLGNLISSCISWPGKDYVWVLVVARILFVPFFLFCNFQPASRHWPVLIHSDVLFILANVLFALSFGYIGSSCMMFTSSGLEADEAPRAGMLAGFFLLLGIFLGVSSSYICTWIVEVG